jgi:hypothetical protein
MSEPVTLYVTPYPDKRGHDTYTTDEGRIPSQHIDKARYRAIPAAEFDALVGLLREARRYVEPFGPSENRNLLQRIDAALKGAP